MEELVAGCTSKKCDYAISALAEEVSCINGSGQCAPARMLSGDITKFHDADLETASKEIQGILDGLEKIAAGRKLSFLNTDEGMFLAWVDHSKPPAPDSIKPEDGYEEIAKALKII